MTRDREERPGVTGLAFDLYGTLLTVGERAVQRTGRRLPGKHGAAWVAALRGLLVRPAETREEFLDALAAPLSGDPASLRAALGEALDRELASVRPARGVLSLLHFWKRRGVRLGLLSNLASPYREPCVSAGIAELLDTALYSCDEGIAKPDPVLYERLCERLGLPPARVLFVGDSLANDVEGARRAGLRTAGLGVSGGDLVLDDLSEAGLLDLSDGRLPRLLSAGETVTLDGARHTVRAISPVGDEDQGRYNLVFRLDTESESGAAARLYLKRFLLPETAWAEELGHRLQAATGLGAVTVAVRTDAGEPLLLLSEAPGRKYEGELTPEISYDLGGHSVFAFLFANADFRPRNAFLVEEGGRTRVAMIDMEHCLFNLALDVEGLADPLNPGTFDRMPAAELAARTKKRVLSQRATSRARRSFFGDTPRESPLTEAFRDGFIDFYTRCAARREELTGLLDRRIHEEPPIVVGTHSYRRALASVDVADVSERLAIDPPAAFEWCY